MSSKCVLLTGGAGYIGSHTAIEVLNNGYSVVVVDNLSNSNMESIGRVEKITGKEISFYHVDITNKPALKDVFKKHRFHAVIHFAGMKSVGESCVLPMEYYKNNVLGTIVLIEVMQDFNVCNIVFSSSCTVYGNPTYLPLDEQHPVGNCTNPYGRTKYCIEQLLNDVCTANKTFNAVLLRYFNPAGSHESGLIGEDPVGTPKNLWPYMAQVAVGRQKELKIFGNDYETPDGTGLRDYIHVVDVAIGHVAALKKVEEHDCHCKIYNLGTGQGYTVLEIIKAFEKASGKKIAYEIVDRRSGDVSGLYADAKLAEIELDWKAYRDLDDMCETFWKWQSMNPDGFGNNNVIKINNK